MLARRLWQENADLARACLAHPFVRGLGDGSLPLDRFRGYVAQDAFYMRVFFRAYALLAARVDDLEDMAGFCELLGGALGELGLHRRYAESLGIDLDEVEPTLATTAYVDFLLHRAWHLGIGEAIAAMTPCMRLYAHLGRELERSARPGPEHPYRDWILTYCGAEFQAHADRLEALLERFARDTAAVRDAYRYAMGCELDFFESAWRG